MESAASAAKPEHRVHVASKKQVVEQMNQYKELLKRLLDGQTDVAADRKRAVQERLAADFEAAVLANVLVKGQTWDEAADEDETDLDVLLDDAAVETTWRRRAFPKRTLPHVVRALRAERALMGLYEEKAQREEAPGDTDQVRTLKEDVAVMVGSAVQVVKSMETLRKQAEGLREILDTKPSDATLEVHRAVFGQSDASSPPASSRRPMRRVVDEAAAAACYGARRPGDPDECLH